MNFEFDITYNCNLACKWCDRLCGTKYREPIDMSVDQFKKYALIVSKNMNSLSRIRILGGEPTLHPQIFEILDLALEILRPKTTIPIAIISNGIGDKVQEIHREIEKKYDVARTNNSGRASSKQFTLSITSQENHDKHLPIFRAGIDIFPNKKSFYSDCWIKNYCGFGVTPYGIFICAGAAPAISTIFKLDVGKDHMLTESEIEEQSKLLCGKCWAPFREYKKLEITDTYQKALKEWDDSPYCPHIVEPKDEM